MNKTAWHLREHRYDSALVMAEELSSHIITILRNALQRRGHATCVFSGGKTPIGLFRLLAHADLPWENITFTLSDERWLMPPHHDSNETMIRKHLLKLNAGKATFIPLYNPSETPKIGLEACTKQLQIFKQPFDITILGMGADGHTASFFPHAPELTQGFNLNNLDVCIPIESQKIARMSLTLKRLITTEHMIVHIAGEEKWQTLQHARHDGSLEEYPIRAVFQHSDVPVDIYWAP